MPIRDLFDYKSDSRPWLITGKGPSFTLKHPLLLLNNGGVTSYNVLTLNQTLREFEHVEFCHIIDTEVLKDIVNLVEDKANYLVMPYFPHFNCRPNRDISILKLIDYNWYPVIRKMADQNRLFCYNLSTSGRQFTPSTMITAFHYSAEAAVHLLAELGVKEIRTLGVDGGNSQSELFIDLKNDNLETGYDKQWKSIRGVIRRNSINFGSLDIECPVRVFVGCSESETIPFLVLKHSIEAHTTMSVSVEPLSKWMERIPEVNDPSLKARTPFSFQRFLIPEICEYQGKAIYLDSDMLVFSDIKDLWTKDFIGTHLVVPRWSDIDRRKAQFSVMLMDCSKLTWLIKEIVTSINNDCFTYSQIMHDMILAPSMREGVCPEWNSLEFYEKGVTKLLHYTDFHTQPWKITNHPLGYLWENAFKDAFRHNAFSIVLLKSHISNGFVRPSLLQVALSPTPSLAPVSIT